MLSNKGGTTVFSSLYREERPFFVFNNDLKGALHGHETKIGSIKN
ncbi:hypothetical protein J2T20_000292 [Paenibacillus wynnii]|nr:hypothetical protein [Paenibacillus wynnii]